MKHIRVSVEVTELPFEYSQLWDRQEAEIAVPDDVTPFAVCEIVQDYVQAVAEDFRNHSDEEGV